MANPICGKPPKGGTSQGLQAMDVRTLFQKSRSGRSSWYVGKLGAYNKQLGTSAACNLIPKQLLATVILNELADINSLDVWQQRLGLSGSLGIAQIQVDTALKHKLLNFHGDAQAIQADAALRQKNCVSYSRSGICMGATRYADRIRRYLVRKRLTIPEFAIEAAAREVRRLLELMTKHPNNPWQQKFGFSLNNFSQITTPNDVYNFMPAPNQSAKEANLAEMVIAAYNSPDVVIAKHQSSIDRNDPKFIYRNATIHGSNGSSIALDLYNMKLFH